MLEGLNSVCRLRPFLYYRLFTNMTSEGGTIGSFLSRRLSDSISDTRQGRVDKLFQGIRNGQRSCLAEAITLVESSNPVKRAMGQDILSLVQKEAKLDYQQRGRDSLSFRIGLSGPPGAGKSTLIEALGSYLTSQDHKLAVLAVDPSSTTRGGSLLGDKTRMTTLSRNLNAFIRPSPTSGKLGGVTRSTNEAILLCEAAGYKLVIVETVGVGQSEHMVVDMVDMFLLLIPPAAGDELQGLKRGIVELSDLIIINKADGDLLPAARRLKSEYVSALKYMQPRSKLWKPKVTKISSFNSEGIPELWKTIQEFRSIMQDNGILEERRREQLKKWLWNYISDNILDQFKNHPHVKKTYQQYEARIANGTLMPGQAADELLNYFFKVQRD